MSSAKADVVVVGAGFAGLSAATTLLGSGVDVKVLEARNRVGGRVESRLNGLGERIDVGGQFLCDDMPELMALAAGHGKTLVETPLEGDFVAQPPLPTGAAKSAYEISAAIRDRVNDIEPDDPAIAGLSVAEWLDRQPDPDVAKNGFRSLVEGLWCQPIGMVPLWYLISNDRRITNEVTELQYFVRETMHALAEDVAAQLQHRLHLGTAVRSIDMHSGGVTVTSGSGIWKAQSTIVAVPPVAASRIVFNPSLPTELRQALAAWRSGTVIKALVRYPKPFWREAGRSGMVMWRDVHGLFACDASPDDARAALIVFTGGPLAERWRQLGEDGLRTEIVARLVAALGPDAAGTLDISLRDWCHDPWSGGGYSDIIVDPTATDAEAVLRQSAWPILFAASELSPSFPGYIEGAIVAGRAAAKRVISSLA